MPNIRWLLALVTAVHRFVYQKSGGRIGASAGGRRMLLLTCRGRRSGRERVTPLLYVDDEAGWVVVASNAGDARNPAWWLNLRARPEASVQIGRERHGVLAREAKPEEHERLWARLVDAYRFYEDYRTRTPRRIPIVVLERRS
jgi:deazaflavin-dependent oxidoreductase (nitroreductase family)